jgi:phosphoglycerate kinase
MPAGLCRSIAQGPLWAAAGADGAAAPAVPVLRKRSVRHVPLGGRTALVRVDFNVPLEPAPTGPEAGSGAAPQRVGDDTRIRAAVPTIHHLLAGGARVVLCSHLGRPKGRRDPRLSLRQVVGDVQRLVGAPVVFSPETVGPVAQTAARNAPPGTVVLLENTRFHEGEERNDPELARELAALGDLFVNDAFGAAHRAHASTVGVARYLPAVGGLLLQREVEALSRLLDPEPPLVAVIGGAKVADKIGVLRQLLRRSQRLLLGGGMANTFLAARGLDMGASLVERDHIGVAAELLEEARRLGVEVLLPTDLVVGEAFAPDTSHRTVDAASVPPGGMALDIGPATVAAFAQALGDARTVFWNGPLGVSEWPNFAAGTAGVAQAVAGCRGFTVVGGGDSIAALRRLGLLDAVRHVSTGGGASLEFLEGRPLPGVACLQDHMEDGR